MHLAICLCMCTNMDHCSAKNPQYVQKTLHWYFGSRVPTKNMKSTGSRGLSKENLVQVFGGSHGYTRRLLGIVQRKVVYSKDGVVQAVLYTSALIGKISSRDDYFESTYFTLSKCIESLTLSVRSIHYKIWKDCKAGVTILVFKENWGKLSMILLFKTAEPTPCTTPSPKSSCQNCYIYVYRYSQCDYWLIWEVVKIRVAPTASRVATRPALQENQNTHMPAADCKLYIMALFRYPSLYLPLSISIYLYAALNLGYHRNSVGSTCSMCGNYMKWDPHAFWCALCKFIIFLVSEAGMPNLGFTIRINFPCLYLMIMQGGDGLLVHLTLKRFLTERPLMKAQSSN